MSIYLAWCLVCLGLVIRLCVEHEHGMAWCGVVWCGIINLRDEALCRYDNKEYSYKGFEGNFPVSVIL